MLLATCARTICVCVSACVYTGRHFSLPIQWPPKLLITVLSVIARTSINCHASERPRLPGCMGGLDDCMSTAGEQGGPNVVGEGVPDEQEQL